jgi:tetratricopeptide (TPR) repeat protein
VRRTEPEVADDGRADEARPAPRLYSVQEAARLSGADPRQLRRWDRSGLLCAGHRINDRLRYDFRDLIAIRTAVGLLGAGARTAQVRQALEALRARLPEVEAPLAQLRVVSDNGHVVVQVDGALMEPVSGQILLDLPIEEALGPTGGEVIVDARLERRATSQRVEPDADEWFERALESEAEGSATDEVERCYRKALEIDDAHAGALLNLGNLTYSSGRLAESRDLYRRAVAAAPGYAEAHYNLANVLDDLGAPDAAISHYESALELAPSFKAAYFNLALVCEKVGDRDRARPNWLRYLSLDDNSASAEVARRFLEEED